MEEIREQIKEMVAYLLDCERTTDKETIESYTETIMQGADKYAEAKFNNGALSDLIDERELLINFFINFRNKGEQNIGMTIEEFVDDYLNNL